MSNKSVTIGYDRFNVDFLLSPENANSLVESIAAGINVRYNPINWSTGEATSEDVLVIADKVLYVKVRDELPF